MTIASRIRGVYLSTYLRSYLPTLSRGVGEGILLERENKEKTKEEPGSSLRAHCSRRRIVTARRAPHAEKLNVNADMSPVYGCAKFPPFSCDHRQTDGISRLSFLRQLLSLPHPLCRRRSESELFLSICALCRSPSQSSE